MSEPCQVPRFEEHRRHRPERPDNHWFDCLMGATAAASLAGVAAPGTVAPARPERIRLSHLQRRSR
jgi:hypothetical protein